MTRILNYMPHTLNIQLADDILEIPSSGVARCKVENVQVDEINGIPVVTAEYGDIVGLPEAVPGTIYVTSMLVAQRSGRQDVFGPDSGPSAIRVDGQVVAVRNLTRY